MKHILTHRHVLAETPCTGGNVHNVETNRMQWPENWTYSASTQSFRNSVWPLDHWGVDGCKGFKGMRPELGPPCTARG